MAPKPSQGEKRGVAGQDAVCAGHVSLDSHALTASYSDVIGKIKGPSTSGSVIRAHRRNWKITLKELSAVTGIAESNLSLIENDKVEIGTRRASLIGAALGIDPAFILFPDGAEGAFKKEVDRVSRRSARLLAEKRKKYAA